MSMQYINLLAPEFRPRRLWLTLERAVAFVTVALVLISGVQLYERQKLDGLREELKAAQALLKNQSVLVDRMRAEMSGPKTVSPLESEVQRLEGELKVARDSMKVLEGGDAGNREGFSGYFEALSRQSIDGLWLTGFSVSGSGDVVIKGRVVRADLVPAYLQRLNRESVLQGREFSNLDLRRPKLPPPKPGEAVVAEAPPPFLEFALMTELPQTSGPAPAKEAGAK